MSEKHFSRIIVVVILVGVGVLGWKLGERLSSDSIAMALGLLFGVLAGLPTALLVLASDRRRCNEQPPQAPPSPRLVVYDETARIIRQGRQRSSEIEGEWRYE